MNMMSADGSIPAGSYRVGICRDERGAMWDANVGTTTRLLDAAEAAGWNRRTVASTLMFLAAQQVSTTETSARS